MSYSILFSHTIFMFTTVRQNDVVLSDHNLVIGKIHLKLKKATKPEVEKTYATEKLNIRRHQILSALSQ